MTKIRLLVLTLVSLLSTTGILSAQMPLRLHLDAAPLFNLSHVESIDKIVEDKVFVGYRVSAGVDVRVHNSLFIGSGLSISMKGCRFNLPQMGEDANIRIYSHYLQVPINVGSRFNLTPGLGISIEAGPYFAFALGTSVSQKNILSTISDTYNIYKDGILGLGDAARLKRWDLGVGANAKINFGSWYGTLGADFGLLNNLKIDDQKIDMPQFTQRLMRNSSFYLGAGYMF